MLAKTPQQAVLHGLNGTAPAPAPLPAPKNPRAPRAVRQPAPRSTFAFDPLEDALAAFARGEFLVVMDDEGRENEGDLIIAASECSAEKMAFMVRHTRCACSICVIHSLVC